MSNDIWLYMTVLFISIGQMPFLAPAINNADPLFALVIEPGFQLHHVEVVADQDSASGSLSADTSHTNNTSTLGLM